MKNKTLLNLTIPLPFVGQFGKLSYVRCSRYRIGEGIDLIPIIATPPPKATA